MRNVILLVLVLLGFIAWLCLPRRPSAPPHQVLGSSEILSDEALAGSKGHAGGTTPGNARKLSTPDPETNPAAWTQLRLKQIEAAKEGARGEWRTLIEFYGKVIDQDNNPVADTLIDFSCNDLSAEGTSTYHTVSDKTGLFSIQGISGKLLVVNVSKPGYYVSNRDAHSFYYAGQNENFIPDPLSPVIFHLRRQGIAEALWHCKNNFHIERDGTPVIVDVVHCSKTSPDRNQLVIQCWTDDQSRKPGEHYNWRCRISVPGGGLVETKNEYDFEAPERGYQAFDEIEMSKSIQSGWHSTEKRKYFAKTAEGAFFRFTFEIVAAGDHFFEIESFFNPSGSRNLEFEPAKGLGP